MSGLLSGRFGRASPRNFTPGAQAGSSMVLLDRKVAYPGLAAMNFAGFDDTYDVYEIQIVSAYPTADSVNFYANLSADGGSTFLTTLYKLALDGYNSSAAAVNAASNSNAQMQIVGGNDLHNGVLYGGYSGIINLFGMGRTDVYPKMSAQGLYINPSQGIVVAQSAAFQPTNIKANAVSFVMAATTFAGGVFNVYGIKNK